MTDSARLRFFSRTEVSAEGRRLHQIDPAGWDRFYRDRWASLALTTGQPG